MADSKAPPKPAVRTKSSRADAATLLGLAVAVGAIMGGLLMEGGRLQDVAQVTAAMIVLGGTVGAVMVSTPFAVLKGAARRLAGVVVERTAPPEQLIDSLIAFATKARKHGLVSLEEEAQEIEEPFLHKALNLAVDGTDIQEIRGMLELQLAMDQHLAEQQAKVFELAGGYSPTIGIIGAVLGLIQVMKNLANIDEVGHGIAVSFVATVYGVGAANLFFLPAATKIKSRIEAESQRKELIIEGVCAIVEGLNPKLIRIKLEAFLAHSSNAGSSPKNAKQATPETSGSAPA